MIARANILEWRNAGYAWRTDPMVEQDLILSRILVDLFSNPIFREQLIFRGGTALHKLCFPKPLRYSEDIDLVQRDPGPIGPIFDALRNALGSWLGTKPTRKQGPGVVNLIYRVPSEDTPPLNLRIKIEINTREHFQMLPLQDHLLNVDSRWFAGSAQIVTYAVEELLATKLRALYQRRKGRDLFDLAAALREIQPDPTAIVDLFQHYMKAEGQRITKPEFLENLQNKYTHPAFAEDCLPLLRPSTTFDLAADAKRVEQTLLSLLPSPAVKKKKQK